jgi:hypothetical protein
VYHLKHVFSRLCSEGETEYELVEKLEVNGAVESLAFAKVSRKQRALNFHLMGTCAYLRCLVRYWEVPL